ncbi:MAG TPA: iron-containing redox enzyme family protein [Solirubrobacteraceae bacterium]
MELWSELATLHTRLDALKHPFYLRWQAGELTRPELADYAGQYRHAVVALADASDRAAELDPALRAHAVEEREHVTLWDGFLTAMGGDACAPARAGTLACATAWAGADDRALVPTLAALHAIESTQPGVSKTKRAGLVERYGVTPGPATAYFELHETRDAQHAADARERLERLATPADEPAIVAETERVLGGYLALLDGVTAA